MRVFEQGIYYYQAPRQRFLCFQEPKHLQELLSQERLLRGQYQYLKKLTKANLSLTKETILDRLAPLSPK